MTDIEKTQNAFLKLGKLLSQKITIAEDTKLQAALRNFTTAKDKALAANPWFTMESIDMAISNIAVMLEEKPFIEWANAYPIGQNQAHRIGVVMAGNIPLVGFHDFLCVLTAGHHFVGKLSRDDKYLLPALAEILTTLEPALKDKIHLSESNLKDFDAIIATGSGNTSRYFEYYFGKYPHIIRHNRHGIAVLTGEESPEDLRLLAKDVFSYFGLGCRNVSMLFVPEGYRFDQLLDSFSSYSFLQNHSKYFNNYEYNKAIFLVNQEPHYDNGFVLLHQNDRFGSAVSVLHFQYYTSAESLQPVLNQNQHLIQCVVSHQAQWPDSVSFGEAQSPELSAYADGIDTMSFLCGLSALQHPEKER